MDVNNYMSVNCIRFLLLTDSRPVGSRFTERNQVKSRTSQKGRIRAKHPLKGLACGEYVIIIL